MKMTDKDDDLLATAFAEMRAEDAVPSDDLLNRIMLDADQVLADAAPAMAPQAKPGLGSMLLDVIGGWPSFSGLAAATVAGIWVGVAPPDALTSFASGYWSTSIEVPLLETDFLTGLEG